MTQATAITLDDISAQVRDLSRLLSVIRDDLYDLDYGPKSAGTQKHLLDRVQSLTTIACETAERTAAQIEENYHQIRQPTQLVHQVPDEILEIGSEVLALYERFNRRRKAAGGEA